MIVLNNKTITSCNHSEKGDGEPSPVSKRIMIAGMASGSGKTLVTCGLMKALRQRGLRIHGMKCGPDFIDPMFHERVLGIKSRNLDSFLMDPEQMRTVMSRHTKGADITVIEGVMGYYDGAGAVTDAFSAYEIASRTRTPVILVVDASGASLSIVPQIRGMVSYRVDAGIRGIILNRISDALADRLSEVILRETGIPVVGNLPSDPAFMIGSRHLGLLLPDEIEGLDQRLEYLSDRINCRFDLEGILRIAEEAPAISVGQAGSASSGVACRSEYKSGLQEVRIALASDEAFCFMYEDNLQMLQDLGARLIRFSPVHDRCLPDNIRGLLLPGGYPELYVEKLSQNISMRNQIRAVIENGMPVMAECGGFLYLHRELRDSQDRCFPMVGALDAEAFYVGKTDHFGYITITTGEGGLRVRAHEHHAYASTSPGSDCIACKPVGNRKWRCLHRIQGGLWGFPHLYYPSAVEIPETFLASARLYNPELRQ